jgi:putative radical SAM enzyme (TIGR03279 family)
MSLPSVAAVDPGSPADVAGVQPGDQILAINGQVPRDVIEYRLLVDEPDVELELRRGGLELTVAVEKAAGSALGAEISSALFDQVRTCDNHCEFCFIYQLPKGLRPSLYMKDDDYRLSFLYGNFTTLTRFTEADLERVVSERLSPLFVSIHATDPDVRARMLRNRRGAVSLRWLRALLDHGIEVHGQVVVCPGVNDGAVLADTLTGVLDEYPELSTAAVVPLGISRFSQEQSLRPHTVAGAAAVVDLVEEYQEVFARCTGRRVVHAADEYYLMAGRGFPAPEVYEGFPQHENGIGMAAAFAAAFHGDAGAAHGRRPGFFAWVDGAPAAGYRARRADGGPAPTDAGDGVTVLTGQYGAEVIAPLVRAQYGEGRVDVVAVENRFFGGNIAVSGLLTGGDVATALEEAPPGRRFLLGDACLSEGRFLDGVGVDELPHPVQVVASDGLSLRRALDECLSPAAR